MSNLAVSTQQVAMQQKKQPTKPQVQQKPQESVSFFDEKWSGYQIAKLTGDNDFTDWLQNKDKVCTDGKDDGNIGLWEGVKSFGKGLIGGIPKAMINHPLATAITIGLGTVATAATGGAILPVLGAIGVLTGVGMSGYGTYKAITAKTDGEAKQALETLGMGVTSTALSIASADKALEKAAEAGVESAKVSKDAGIIDKTVQMFKATPEALKVGKNQYMSNKLGVTYKSYISGKGQVNKRNIETIHESADNAVNSIIDDANRSGRALNEVDYARIEHIRAQEKNLIQKIHSKAQLMDKDEHVWLVDDSRIERANVGFGGDRVRTFLEEKHYGRPSCVVGEEGQAASNYAKNFGIRVEDVSPEEVKLGVWSKQLDQVSHNNWNYQSKCEEIISNMLDWYKHRPAKNINFNETDADRMRLLRYLELTNCDSERTNAILHRFDQTVATKKAELSAIMSNEAKRGTL